MRSAWRRPSRDLLELERYTADICHDGESGLDNALSDIYDLVILDVMLPKKDGFSVLRALRQAGKTVPVLMLSARSELADRVEGLDCGADYYLTKPFEPKELLACVRMLTRRQPEQRPLRIWNTAICGWKRIPFSLAAESGLSGSAGRNLICWSC